MKKLLFLFMVFFFLGVFTVTATPVEEKQVMVFVLDVGLVTLPVIVMDQLDTIMETVKLEVLYLFRKIVYEPMVLLNGQTVIYRECQTVGDHIPIAS